MHRLYFIQRAQSSWKETHMTKLERQMNLIIIEETTNGTDANDLGIDISQDTAGAF